MGDVARRALLAGLVSAPLAAQAAGRRSKAAHDLSHDLTGTWTNAWYTKLERPKAFKALVATPAEAEAFEAPRRALHGAILSPHDELGQATSEFPDNGPGLARIGGEIRTSWIVDPADGKVPWIKAQWKKLRLDEDSAETDADTFANVEDRDTDERCLTAPGGFAPIVNSQDGNVMSLVLTADHLVIVAEKNHQVRIVRIGPPGARLGRGLDLATGHWEGATLVVENANYRPGVTRIEDGLYLTDQARVVERFTRTGPGEINYRFEVSDPAMFTRAWRGEAVFRRASGRQFEYACHEGNYALPSILRAARAAEAAATANGGR
ncbi:MAG: hypothetical protein ACJ798_05520 [Phenylobacterium sp.]